MVSKSTKRKHRRNKGINKILSTVRLLCVDSRVNFWLLSIPITEHRTHHIEIYGHKKALRELRRVNRLLWRAFDVYPRSANDTSRTLMHFEFMINNRY